MTRDRTQKTLAMTREGSESRLMTCDSTTRDWWLGPWKKQLLETRHVWLGTRQSWLVHSSAKFQVQLNIQAPYQDLRSLDYSTDKALLFHLVLISFSLTLISFMPICTIFDLCLWINKHQFIPLFRQYKSSQFHTVIRIGCFGPQDPQSASFQHGWWACIQCRWTDK